jgi:CheY-like chemotaxis protein
MGVMAKSFILIVEDDIKLAGVYRTVLEQVGFDSISDTTGNECMAILSRLRPVLIILDLHMPFVSGVEILRKIREDQRLVGIPLIVTTADIFLAKAVQDQAEDVLIKPVSVSRLRQAVLRLCPAGAGDEPDRMD